MSLCDTGWWIFDIMAAYNNLKADKTLNILVTLG